MSETTNKVPDSLDRIDHLELQLSMSEVERIKAQLVVLKTQAQMLQPKLSPAQQKFEQLQVNLRDKYSLTDKDSVNVETGAITRG